MGVDWTDIIWSSLQKNYGRKAAEAFYELFKRGELYVLFSSTGTPRVIRKRGPGGEDIDIAYYNPVSGVLTLSEQGAIQIFQYVEKKYKRIVVSGSDFCKYTRGSLLAPIVRYISNDVRPGDEVFIVDENDNLLGVGKSVISSVELTGIRRGEVAKVRRKVRCRE